MGESVNRVVGSRVLLGGLVALAWLLVGSGRRENVAVRVIMRLPAWAFVIVDDLDFPVLNFGMSVGATPLEFLSRTARAFCVTSHISVRWVLLEVGNRFEEPWRIRRW